MTDTKKIETCETEGKSYIVSEQMKEVWACEMNLLKELLRVCQKHNLQIWADAGTLIGAVRHHGFIPWDDDIDMVMFRSDYDKLVQIADKEFSNPYFFQTIYSDKHYTHRHAQLRNSNTAAIPESNKTLRCNQGIFIDIFILDSCPKTLKGAQAKIKRVKRARSLLKIAQGILKLFPEKWYNKCRWDKYMFKKYEDVLRQPNIDETEYVACISLNMREKIRLKSDYATTILTEFEDMQIPIPAGYDRILRTDYGDYMTPVQAPTQHGHMIYDTKKSFIEVLKDLQQKKQMV